MDTPPLTRLIASRSARPRWVGTHLGPWELLGPIGEGEWATVYRARPRGTPEHGPVDYAIKVAKAGPGGVGQASRLLAREAVVGSQVTHPHLVAVLSAQVDASPPYLVMPLLRGATLRSVVARYGPLVTPHALWIVRQVSEALESLHAAGWMHADVNPGNIIVSADGHATLLDLGFALQLGTDECAAGGTLRGTLRYTAPEMISSAMSVDSRSDVYSLGATLFELLSGHPPFGHEDAGRLALAHLQDPIPDLRRELPGLGVEVMRLLRDLMAKEPLRRPSAGELVERLVDLEIATLDQRAGNA